MGYAVKCLLNVQEDGIYLKAAAIHVWQMELHLWLTCLVESPIGWWRWVSVQVQVCDALKLWRGLAEERLDGN